MKIAEVLGFGVETQSTTAQDSRAKTLCPFRGTKCTKSSKVEPISVCSLSHANEAAALCPVRLTEGDRMFMEAARIAFGANIPFAIFPEIRLLEIQPEKPGGRVRKIGKVDYLIGRLDGDKVMDFAAIEVQAAYFSGNSIKPALRKFLAGDSSDLLTIDRRPDFRSSAQKRLMPQLQLKIPVFRRWGKKFFVVVDSLFFAALPKFPTVSRANSELTWLSFPIRQTDGDFKIQPVEVHFSSWEDVNTALREGTPPEPEEILAELALKLSIPNSHVRRLISN